MASFQNQFGTSGLQETWIISEKLCGAILCLFFFQYPSTSVVKENAAEVFLLTSRNVFWTTKLPIDNRGEKTVTEFSFSGELFR